MVNGLDPSQFTDPKLASKLIDNHNQLNILQSEKGWVGKLWGSNKSAPNNIAGIVTVSLLLFGLTFTFIIIVWYPLGKEGSTIKDLWSVLTPLITLSLGYLFGKQISKDD